MREYLSDGLHQLGLFLAGALLAWWAARHYFGVDLVQHVAEGLRLIAGVE